MGVLVVVVGRGERVVIKRCGLCFPRVTSPGRRRTSTGRRRSREDGRFGRGGRGFPRRRGRRRSSLNDDLICGRLGGLGDRHRHLLLPLGAALDWAAAGSARAANESDLVGSNPQVVHLNRSEDRAMRCRSAGGASREPTAPFACFRKDELVVSVSGSVNKRGERKGSRTSLSKKAIRATKAVRIPQEGCHVSL